jgi:hypothetical protein
MIRYPFYFGEEPADHMPIEQRYRQIIDEANKLAHEVSERIGYKAVDQGFKFYKSEATRARVA